MGTSLKIIALAIKSFHTVGWSLKFMSRKDQWSQIIHSRKPSVLLTLVPSDTSILSYFNIYIYTNIRLRTAVNNICHIHENLLTIIILQSSSVLFRAMSSDFEYTFSS